jgi:hypothetical protein
MSVFPVLYAKTKGAPEIAANGGAIRSNFGCEREPREDTKRSKKECCEQADQDDESRTKAEIIVKTYHAVAITSR